MVAVFNHFTSTFNILVMNIIVIVTIISSCTLLDKLILRVQVRRLAKQVSLIRLVLVRFDIILMFHPGDHVIVLFLNFAQSVILERFLFVVCLK